MTKFGDPAAREFPVLDILSVLRDRMLSNQGMAGYYALLKFMTGDVVETPQIPRVQAECVGDLALQHPDLAQISIPESFPDDVAIKRWQSVISFCFPGETRPVSPLKPDDHTSMNVTTELHLRGMGDKLRPLEDFIG